MNWRRTCSVLAKIVGVTIALIVLTFAAAIFLIHNDDVDIWRFSEQRSPDDQYSLIVDVGNPAMPFGSHSVKIMLNRANSEAVMEGEFKLSNDGANIDGENIESHWVNNDSAEVCLRGNEQADALISITVSSLTMLEKHGKC